MASSAQHIDRLRLRHLRLLELINTHGSLREVGVELNLTQPAVSQMLKDLEFAFGVPLVDRSVRGVTLRPEGRLALQRARAGLAMFEKLADELDQEEALVLQIGTNPTFLAGLLPKALSRFGRNERQVKYSLRCGTVDAMLHDLSEGVIDCYIGRVDWEQVPRNLFDVIEHTPLLQADLCFVCPKTHPLARQSLVTAKNLEGVEWVLPPLEASTRQALEVGVKALGLQKPCCRIEAAGDPTALLHLALEMNLVTCVPLVSLFSNINAELFHILDVFDLTLPPIKTAFVTMIAPKEIPAIEALREAVLNVASLDFGQDANRNIL
jgi:DNA-binding transcriptional LysR family regulator